MIHLSGGRVLEGERAAGGFATVALAPQLVVAVVALQCIVAAPAVQKVVSVVPHELVCVRTANEDVVVLAGKGHEAYQEVAGAKRPFSDVIEAQQALARRAGLAA